MKFEVKETNVVGKVDKNEEFVEAQNKAVKEHQKQKNTKKLQDSTHEVQLEELESVLAQNDDATYFDFKRDSLNPKKIAEDVHRSTQINALKSKAKQGDTSAKQELKELKIINYDKNYQSIQTWTDRTSFEFGLNTLYETNQDMKITYSGDGFYSGLDFAIPTKITHGDVVIERYVSAKGIDSKLREPFLRTKEKIAKFWLDLIEHNKSSCALISIAKNSLDLLERERITSLSGTKLAHRCVPALSAFPENLRSIDIKTELLNVFPEAEADTLMIHFGRMCAGVGKDAVQEPYEQVSGTKTAESIEYEQGGIRTGKLTNTLEHNYRSSVILFGEAAIGKTTLWTSILQALVMCGYTYDTMPHSNNQFGWSCGLKDIVYAPDLALADILDLQQNKIVKALWSSETDKLENKGSEAYKARFKAGFIALANEVAYSKNRDRGIIDRLHFLQTCSAGQLKLKCGEKNVYEHMRIVAQKYSCKEETLALLILRRSLDYFLEQTGHVWNEATGTYTFEFNRRKIDETLRNNRARYSFKPEIDTKQLLCVSSVKAYTISLLAGQNVDDEYTYGICMNQVLHLGKTICNIQHKIKDCQDAKELDKAEFFTKLYHWVIPERSFKRATWQKYTHTLEQDFQNKEHDLDRARWERHIKNLELGDNTRFPEEITWYKTAFDLALTEIEVYKAEFKAICEKYNFDFEPVASGISAIFESN